MSSWGELARGKGKALRVENAYLVIIETEWLFVRSTLLSAIMGHPAKLRGLHITGELQGEVSSITTPPPLSTAGV